jgi:hypothetical protein
LGTEKRIKVKLELNSEGGACQDDGGEEGMEGINVRTYPMSRSFMYLSIRAIYSFLCTFYYLPFYLLHLLPNRLPIFPINSSFMRFSPLSIERERVNTDGPVRTSIHILMVLGSGLTVPHSSLHSCLYSHSHTHVHSLHHHHIHLS